MTRAKWVFILVAAMFSLASLPALAQDSEPVYKKVYDEAKALYEKGEYVRAAALFLEVKRLALEDGLYTETIDYRIGLCYEKAGNLKEAIKHYKIYADGDDINEKVATREEALAKIDELEKRLVQVETKTSVNVDELRNVARNLYNQADQFVKENNFAAALALYLQVKDISVKGKFYQHILDYQIGYCYYWMKDYENAIKHYSIYLEAPELNSNWPDKLKIQRYIKEMQVAIEQEKKAVSSVQMDERTRQLWKEGQARYNNRQFAMARASFENAKKHMQSRGAYREWIEVYIGRTYEAQENYQEAIKSYKLYVNSPNEEPNLPKSTFKAIIADLEKRLQAQVSSKELLEKFARNTEKARRLLENGKPAEARALLEQNKKEAIAAKLYNHKMDWDIGVTYDREGNYKMAIQHYRIYLEAPSFQPGWPDRYRAESRIQFLEDELRSRNRGPRFGLFGVALNDGEPGIVSGDENSITSHWWFWAGVAVVGIVVLALVLDGSSSSSTDGKKSNPPGFGGEPIPNSGVTVLRF